MVTKQYSRKNYHKIKSEVQGDFKPKIESEGIVKPEKEIDLQESCSNENMQAKIIENTEMEITFQNPADKEIDLQESVSNLDSSVKISTSLFGAKQKKKLARPVVIPEMETVMTRRTVTVEKKNANRPLTSIHFTRNLVL